MLKSKQITAMLKSAKSKDILKPRLAKYLADVADLQSKGKLSKKDSDQKDTKLSITAFKERLAEFNHGEDPKGEFFHPSALGQCMRKIFYQYYDAPPNPTKPSIDDTLRTYLVFTTGTYIHVLIQNLCEMAGVLEKREAAILDAERKIIGHGDGILNIDGTRYLLEIKTINSTGFARLKEPEKGHRRQIHAYMRTLGLRHAIVLYYDKDRQQLKEYVVDYVHSFYLSDVKNIIFGFFRNIRSKTLPDREGASPTSYPCMYCDYSRLCYSVAESAKFADKLKKMKGTIHEVKKDKK